MGNFRALDTTYSPVGLYLLDEKPLIDTVGTGPALTQAGPRVYTTELYPGLRGMGIGRQAPALGAADMLHIPLGSMPAAFRISGAMTAQIIVCLNRGTEASTREPVWLFGCTSNTRNASLHNVQYGLWYTKDDGIHAMRLGYQHESGLSGTNATVEANVSLSWAWPQLVGFTRTAGGLVSIWYNGKKVVTDAALGLPDGGSLTELRIGARMTTHEATHDGQWHHSLSSFKLNNFAFSDVQMEADYAHFDQFGQFARVV